jgi:hypothetical protein
VVLRVGGGGYTGAVVMLDILMVSYS